MTSTEVAADPIGACPARRLGLKHRAGRHDQDNDTTLKMSMPSTTKARPLLLGRGCLDLAQPSAQHLK